MRAARDRWLNPVLALSICAVSGAAFAQMRMPLPWMTGPLLAMAGCNFAGAELRAPGAARPLGQIVIGTALGLYFTPLVAREVLSYWPLMLFAAVIALLLGALGGWILTALCGTDRTTAFFASVPGGAAEMTLLGERFGARADRVALSQSLRILVVVIVVPLSLTLSGAHGSDSYAPVSVPLNWGWLALLLGAGASVGLLLQRHGLPNAFMFGPLAVSIVLTASGAQLSSVPAFLSALAQLLIGCALGARFERRSIESAPRFVGAVLASVLSAIGLAAALAVAIAWSLRLPAATVVLAMAPGGIAEMCITAKVLRLGVPLVTAVHVARVFVLILATGPLVRATHRALARRRRT